LHGRELEGTCHDNHKGDYKYQINVWNYLKDYIMNSLSEIRTHFKLMVAVVGRITNYGVKFILLEAI
jgi:hypothetical protein